MPLFDFQCPQCGHISEILVTHSIESMTCKVCGNSQLKKLLSPHSSASGFRKTRLPGPSDTSCCGSSPGEAQCSGPGSCCGQNRS